MVENMFYMLKNMFNMFHYILNIFQIYEICLIYNETYFIYWTCSKKKFLKIVGNGGRHCRHRHSGEAYQNAKYTNSVIY